MGKILVYRYEMLDQNVVKMRTARRWGTRKAIDGLKSAEIIEESATLVDGTVLNDAGFTPLDFDPPAG
jgi:hypothetical protein